MSVVSKPFGVDIIGRQMTLYTMTNKSGAQVSVLDWGAHLVSVKVPDKNGKLNEVCLGYDTLEEYDRNGCCLGASIGRYGNRIKGARFTLNGQEYSLFANEGKNTLHGGREGFDKKWWKGEILESENEDAVIFTYYAHDGEEGFPGKMKVQITYSFDSDCRLGIFYLAQSDKDTVVNLTNHSYFNLSGKENVLDQTLKLNADYVTEVDSELIPTGRQLPLAGTLLDLKNGKKIGDVVLHPEKSEMVKAVNGFDFNFVLNGSGMKEAAVMTDEESGRVMRVWTTEPAIQIYSGQGLHQTGHDGVYYGAYAGIALETQHYPDSPNHPEFPTTTLKAGETFSSKTVYAFETL